jgi:hypothetical protein
VGNATPTFTRFDAPGAGAGSLQGTAAIGIDAAGDVTGTYLDAKGVAHGFLREANGTILTFSAPGAGTAAGPNKNYDFSPYFQGTIPVGINTAKEIAGTYIDGNYNYHGFVRAANGQITPFDVTGDIMVSPYEQAMGTRPIGINAAGEIVGTYMDPNGQYHGFVRASNGQITPFDALSSETGVWTLPSGIDATGKIAGTYIDANGAHGFIRDIGGGITPVDVEGAGGSANLWQLAGTVAIGINAGGEVAGAYTDAIPDDYSSVRHGFVRAADGTITTFNAPGAGSGVLVGIGGGELAGTAGVGINAAGEIAGAYLDADAVYHGFLRAASGSMTTFDVPGAGAGPVQGTIATSVNDAGVVTGSYLDANYTAHGFILNSELTPTTIQLSFTPNPSLYWEPVTLTAKVEATSAGAMPPNGDIVTFMYAAKALGTGRLNGGEASFTTTALPVGKDSITAVYGGNAVMSLAGSTSNAVTEPVGRAKSYITFTSNPNPSSVSQPVTFIATVQGQFGGKATGAVTFSDGKTVLKSVALTGGSAKIATSSLTLGTHSITATYGGDTNFTGSSDSMTQTVN